MNVLVLGCGKQGRAAIHHLRGAEEVERLACADRDIEIVRSALAADAEGKVDAVALDATNDRSLRRTFAAEYDVIVDLLPRQFGRAVAQAAIEAGVHLVNTNYDRDVRDLDEAARQAGVALLPEMGMDPGIDLVLAAEAVRRLDTVETFLSYGGGVPEPSAADDNPLRYKITWTWEGVLHSYHRPARQMHNGDIVEIERDRLFDEAFAREIEVDGLGRMEAFPNGDAAVYVERLGIGDTVKTAGRYALRWPGHRAIWKAFVDLGFLETEPVPGLPGGVTPREFMNRHLELRLQYEPQQKDVVVIRVQADGMRAGRRRRVVFDVVDTKDLATDLTAMSRTVGFSAGIAARMIGRGEIRARGLLSPIVHVPFEGFMAELWRCGIHVWEEESMLSD